MRHHLLCPVSGRGPLTQLNIHSGRAITTGGEGGWTCCPPSPSMRMKSPLIIWGDSTIPPLGISLLTLKRGNSKVPAWYPHCPKWHPPPPPILVWQIQQVGGSCDRNYCLFFNIFQDLAKMWKPTNNNELDSKRYLTSLKLQVFSSLYLQ